MDIFNIPKIILPTVKKCSDNFGTTIPNLFDCKININGIAGDQQAAAIGQACFTPGMLKSTYGTGCFLMVNTEDNPVSIKEGLLTTIAYKLEGRVHYAIEGSIYSCGNIIKWLRDKMKFFNSAIESESFIDKEGNSNNVLFLPAFNGLGAPFWDSDIRGGFYGITQDTTITDMTTASFLAIAFQTKEITSILQEYDIQITNLSVDGGMVQNNSFCQLLADTLNKKIIQPKNVESTAIGACKVCMLASGLSINNVKNDDVNVFTPNTELTKTYDSAFNDWKSYVEKSLTTS